MRKFFVNIMLGMLALTTLNSCQYNSMVEKQETIDERWSQVETQYQRRADLIPNLVNTVKGYADFEQATLTGVIEARAKATSIQIDPSKLDENSLAQFEAAQGQLSGALSRLMLTVERYPDLKANQNFRDLQAQLEGTENRIAVARKNFNEVVRDYNTYIRKFPNNLVAGLFNFEKRPYFESAAGTEVAPTVSF
ncbi:MAG: LemA family protein [Luteibaculaceae bacterium]